MRTLRSKRLRRGLALSVGLAMSGCTSPTIHSQLPAAAPAPVAVVAVAPVPAPKPALAPHEAATVGWPEHARLAALAMVKEYGPPAETTPTALTWYRTGPFKRTVAHRDELAHKFPAPHLDVLEQVIDLRVPPEKLAELAAFDGSLVANRTRGELASFGDSEQENLLALNLANEIVIGNDTAEQARRAWIGVTRLIDAQGPQPFTRSLVFAVPSGGTTDPDQPLRQGPGHARAVARRRGAREHRRRPEHREHRRSPGRWRPGARRESRRLRTDPRPA